MEKRPFTKGSGSTFEDIEENQEILEDIDPKMRPLIKLCMSKKLRTFASCEGHPEEKPGFGQIVFESIEDPRTINMAAWFLKTFGNERVNVAFFNNLRNLDKQKVSQCQLNLEWHHSLTDKIVPQMMQVIKSGYIDKKSEKPLPHWFELMKKISLESSAKDINAMISKDINSRDSWGGFVFSHAGQDKDAVKRIIEIGEEFKKSGIASFERPGGPKTPEQVIEPFGFRGLGVTMILDEAPDEKVCKLMEKVEKILSDGKNRGQTLDLER